MTAEPPEGQAGEGPEEPDGDRPPGSETDDLRPALPDWARWTLRGSFFLTFLLGFLLILGGTPILDALWTSVLLLLLPGLAVAQLPLVDAEEELDRREVYAGSGVLLVVLGLGSLVLGLRRGGKEVLGLEAMETLPLLAWTGGLVAGAGVLVVLFHLAGRRLGIRERPILRRLLPVTGQERSLFGALSLCAGFGEEMAYRGYLIPVLASMLGSVWWAAALSSGVFGVLHAYQGALGILRTGLMGFVFAAGFLVTGSLWPAMVAHAVVDILIGLVFSERLLDEEPSPTDGPAGAEESRGPESPGGA